MYNVGDIVKLRIHGAVQYGSDSAIGGPAVIIESDKAKPPFYKIVFFNNVNVGYWYCDYEIEHVEVQ